MSAGREFHVCGAATENANIYENDHIYFLTNSVILILNAQRNFAMSKIWPV